MTESEIRNLIRDEIRNAIAPILMGMIVENKDEQRTSVRRLPNESPFGNLRNIQNFGISSRAPKGTSCLVCPIAGDITHQNVVGHFDTKKPTIEKDGETILYDSYGHIVYLSESKMQFGSKSSANPMVLGDLLMTMLANMLDKIAQHTHVGNLGIETSPPTTASEFESIKASPVNDGTLISSKAFTEK